MTESEALKVLKKPTEHIRAEDDDCIFSSAYAKALETALEALEEVQQLHAIGTVSEFRELKEKATAKRPIEDVRGFYIWLCPNCKDFVFDERAKDECYRPKCCDVCGQKLDWSEGKEL